MRGRVIQRWLKAQSLNNETRKSKNGDQGHVVVRIIWLAMERLWPARNRMEHRATEEERSLHQTTRMNEKLNKAFLKKFKVSEIVRTQLFQIPQCHRHQYKLEANEQWLDMVEAAVKNRQRQNDKLYETLGRITLYYKQAHTQVNYKSSIRAQSYNSRKYD